MNLHNLVNTEAARVGGPSVLRRVHTTCCHCSVRKPRGNPHLHWAMSSNRDLKKFGIWGFFLLVFFRQNVHMIAKSLIMQKLCYILYFVIGSYIHSSSKQLCSNALWSNKQQGRIIGGASLYQRLQKFPFVTDLVFAVTWCVTVCQIKTVTARRLLKAPKGAPFWATTPYNLTEHFFGGKDGFLLFVPMVYMDVLQFHYI